jgi:LytTr DNA-binding domain
MIIKCLALDDEPLALDKMSNYIRKTPFLELTGLCRSGFETLIHVPGKEGSDREYLFVKSDYKVVRISLNEIIYIEGMREYVRIHLVSGKSVMTLLSLRVLEEQLPSAIFMRVHRSYIVNLQKIMTIDHSRIIFDGKEHIPVSEQYKEFFQKFLNLHSLG